MSYQEIEHKTPSKEVQELIINIIKVTTESNVKSATEIVAALSYCITSFALKAPDREFEEHLLKQALLTMELAIKGIEGKSKSKLH